MFYFSHCCNHGSYDLEVGPQQVEIQHDTM